MSIRVSVNWVRFSEIFVWWGFVVEIYCFFFCSHETSFSHSLTHFYPFWVPFTLISLSSERVCVCVCVCSRVIYFVIWVFRSNERWKRRKKCTLNLSLLLSIVRLLVFFVEREREHLSSGISIIIAKNRFCIATMELLLFLLWFLRKFKIKIDFFFFKIKPINIA